MLPFNLRQEIDFFSKETSSRALLNPETFLRAGMNPPGLSGERAGVYRSASCQKD